MRKYVHYVNDHNRSSHRFSILYADDGYGNLISTEDSVNQATDYIVDGQINNH